MTDPSAILGRIDTSRREAWEVTLDRIELDLVRAERALESDLGPGRIDEWQAPDYYGPIPVSLRPRAEDILARQQVAMRRIAEQLGVTSQHQAIVESVTPLLTRSHDRSVYVDVNA